MPAPTGPLTHLTRAIREGRLTATALVTESIERLVRAEQLNVTAEESFDDALAEAASIDRGERVPGALLGMPTLI